MHTQYFQKRDDLTSATRCLIGYLVAFQNRRGLVSKLSCKYNISRRFIYNLAKKSKDLDSPSISVVDVACVSEKERSLGFILRLRLEGNCSLESIHALMVGEGYRYNSVGFISETLKKAGAKLGSAVVSDSVEVKKNIIYCCDEIYAKRSAVLITVEPISWAILHIELSEKCDSVSWETHWADLKARGYEPLYVVKDEGSALSSGHDKMFGDAGFQSDTFHGVAHRLGVECSKLETAAYKAIAAEYQSLALLKDTKTTISRVKRRKKYVAAKKVCKKAVELYDNFAFLYHCLLACFQVFDKQGQLKELSKTLADFDAALELLKEVDKGRFNKQVESITACKKDLFYFVQIAQQKVAELAKNLDKTTLQKLCLAWQTQKNYRKIKHNSHTKDALKRKEAYLLAEIQLIEPTNFSLIQLKTYETLDLIVQASSAVEGVNSILRPYLNNSKNNVTQEFLNLFRFYHNHRRFYAGKRKGKTPNEILTQQVQKNQWIDILIPKIA